MKPILIVYCSLSGNTKAAAEAVAEGARAAGAPVALKTACEAHTADLLECGAAAFGSYDAFSYMGGALKDFFDRTYYPTQDKVAGRPYAAFVTHGGGGRAAQSIESVAASFKLKPASPAVLVKGRPRGASLDALRALGAQLAEAARAG